MFEVSPSSSDHPVHAFRTHSWPAPLMLSVRQQYHVLRYAYTGTWAAAQRQFEAITQCGEISCDMYMCHSTICILRPREGGLRKVLDGLKSRRNELHNKSG